ncbi:MAG: ABC transporter ATP-binding protein [Eubacteriales bacterium]|nr:ABC transporter ATP-binding protein [Eubacteriales bacterium]
MKSAPNRPKTEEKYKLTDKSLKSHYMKRLLKLSLQCKKYFFAAILCVLLVNIVQLVKPYVLKIVIDDFLIAGKPQTGLYSITGLGIIYFVISLMSSFFSYTQVNLINKAGQTIIMGVRSRVFKAIQLLPLSFLDKTSSGRLITRATNDVGELNELYTDIIINLIKDFVLLIGIVSAMFIMDVQLTLISFLVIPVMAFIVVFLKNKIKANFYNMKHFIGRINGFMAENISGMKTVQIFRGEKEKEKEFTKLNDDYMKTTLIQIRLHSLLKPASELFQNLAVAILIWYGMNKIAGHSLQIGVLFAFTTYIKQFFNPISDLAEKYTSIQSSLVSADRIFELLDQVEIFEDLDKGEGFDRIKGDIEFQNVWFAYNENNWVLRDVSFRIPAGSTAAFVGETGAGKTTIISLVNGFYKVSKGRILIDGKDINTLKLRDLRRNIAVVLQDVFLFSGTIRSNITLNNNIDDTKIRESLNLSCADTFVDELPGGLDEPVMERGNTFSSGQRQLLAFARALAQDPSVIVLDEATANIDTHTEKLIQKAIENSSKGKTTLVIAHRLSTIRNSDAIFVMKDGEVAESGKHAELAAAGGYYSEILNNN